MKIYTPQITNEFDAVLPAPDCRIPLDLMFNMRPLLHGWVPLHFEFVSFETKIRLGRPQVSVIQGAIAFRADLIEQIFPEWLRHEFEFLPIFVSGEKWLIYNCLDTIDDYDRDESVLYRDLDGPVYMIIHVIVPEHVRDRGEIFVLSDSNRTTMLVLPSFVERITALGLPGITFREIGVTCSNGNEL